MQMPKLLFVTGSTFYPESSGGAQRSALFLFESLTKLGWEIQIVCRTSVRSRYARTALSKLQLTRAIPDNELGYPVWRWLGIFGKEETWLTWFDDFLDTYQPDIVMGHNSPQCFLLNRALARGYACYYFIRSLTCFELGQELPKGIYPIANSPLAAQASSSHFDHDIPVVLPFVDRERYLVSDRKREYITLINPIPQKGVEIALALAKKMPDRNFLFVKGKWSTYKKTQIDAIVKPADALPNVEIWEYQSDMRKVYGVTDILLVPSQFTETFGRVIIEAQANKIPVVAAQVGGIPFTLGAGGILANPKDSVEPYFRALNSLMDEEHYAKISELAYQNSLRPEFDPAQQVQNFITAVSESTSKKDQLSVCV
ncbi:MAG: glycosyltransferase family 4 protein [Cyanobacteria bacterium P01_B01_bin.77]